MTSFFPIEGIFRTPLLILEGFIIILGIQYGLYFINKFYKQEKERNYLLRGWAFFFLCFTAMTICFLIGDLFVIDGNIREIFVNVGYFFMGSGAFFFCFNIERELKFKIHYFSIFLSITVSLLVVNFVLNLFSLGIDKIFFVILCWIPFLVLLLIYIFKFTAKIKGEWRLNIYGFIIGFILYGISYILITDKIAELSQGLSRLIGDIFIIVGMSLISMVLIGLPRLEFEWKDKLKTVLIIHKSGVCISSYNVGKGDEPVEIGAGETEDQFIAGRLTGISNMISEIIETKDKDNKKHKIEIMDHKDVKIMFQYGEHLIAAIIADQALNIFKFKLNKLIKYLEGLYADMLPHFNPDELYQFKPINAIIQRFLL